MNLATRAVVHNYTTCTCIILKELINSEPRKECPSTSRVTL